MVALHPVPAVRLNLLQGRVHHSSYNSEPNTILMRACAHTIFLISVRAGSTGSWASPVCLTHAHFCEGIPLKAKPTGIKQPE